MEPLTPHARFVSRSPRASSKPRPRNAKKPTPTNWLTHVIRLCAIPFWGGIWVSIFLVGMVATGSLINPNTSPNGSLSPGADASPSANPGPNPSPTASPSPADLGSGSAAAIAPDSAIATHPEASQGAVPVWLFGAIAVVCAGGSILISRRLYPKRSPRRTVVRPRKRVVYPVSRTAPVSQRSSASQRSSSQRSSSQHSSSQHSSKALQPFVPTATPLRLPKTAIWKKSTPANDWVPLEATSQERSPSFSISTNPAQPRSAPPQAGYIPPAASVPVTIVPVEELHPLDLQEGSMDTTELQRQRSLQFWFDTPTH